MAVKYEKAYPKGRLYTQGREYLLLRTEPDKWGDHSLVWDVLIPEMIGAHQDKAVYARCTLVVNGPFCIEFKADMGFVYAPVSSKE